MYLRGVRTVSEAWFAGSPTKATVAGVPMIEGPIQGPALLCAALAPSAEKTQVSHGQPLLTLLAWRAARVAEQDVLPLLDLSALSDAPSAVSASPCILKEPSVIP